MIFIIDTNIESLAVNEAKILNITIVAILTQIQTQQVLTTPFLQ